MLRLTGETKYADAIEQTTFNALLASMKPDGSDWAKYTPLSGQRMEGTEQCNMGLNCCVASGPRGLFTIPLSAVMQTHEGLHINFYAEGSYKARTPANQDIEIIQKTMYPEDGRITIKMLLPEPEIMTLRLRIPSWSQITKVRINGETVENGSAGDWTVIRRQWKAEDVIELELDMRGRVIRMGNQPEYAAILRGPVVLVRDARLQGPSVGAIIEPIADNNSFINLTRSDTKVNGVWMQFKADCMLESYAEEGPKPVQTEFCDYSTAGNTYDEKSLFRVWLPQLYNPREEE